MIKKSLKVHLLAISDLTTTPYSLHPWIEFSQLSTGYMATDTNDKFMLQVQLFELTLQLKGFKTSGKK